jgi:hypothetical protein
LSRAQLARFVHFGSPPSAGHGSSPAASRQDAIIAGIAAAAYCPSYISQSD